MKKNKIIMALSVGLALSCKPEFEAEHPDYTCQEGVKAIKLRCDPGEEYLRRIRDVCDYKVEQGNTSGIQEYFGCSMRDCKLNQCEKTYLEK